MKKYILGILLFLATLFIPGLTANANIMSLDETEGMPISLETDENWTSVLDTDYIPFGTKISLRNDEALYGYFEQYTNLSNAIINEYGSINELFDGKQSVTLIEKIGSVRFEIDLKIDHFFNCSNSCYIGSGEQNDTCKINIINVYIDDIMVAYADFTSGGCHNNCDEAIDIHSFTDPGYLFDTYNVVGEYENYDTSVATWASYMFETMFYFSDAARIKGIYDFEEAGTSISFNTLKLSYDFMIASGANGANVSVNSYEHYYDKIGDIFYSGFLTGLERTDYHNTITMHSSYTGSTYELRFSVTLNDNNECTYLVELYDGTKTEILLHILYSSNRVMTFKKVTSEYNFDESVVITDFGSWKKSEFNENGYYVGLTPATADELSCLGFYGYELVDYGDVVAPTIKSKEFVLNVDSLLSVDDMLKQVNVVDDRDLYPEIIVESSTYKAEKKIGTFYINVHAVDDDRNKSATQTLTIQVKDFTAPTVNAVDKSVKSTETLTEEDILGLFTVSDNYYSIEDLEIEITKDDYTENAATIGKYEVVLKATDPSNNSVSKTAYVNVIADISGEDIPTPDTPVTPEDPEEPNQPNTPDTPSNPEEPVDYKYDIQNIFKGEFWSNYAKDLTSFNFAWIHWTTLGLALLLVLSIVGAIKKKKS